MKLKTILPLLDDLSPCKVFLVETEKLIFEGRITDIPWRLLECQLFHDKVGVWHNESGEDVTIAYFNIWIIGGNNEIY